MPKPRKVIETSDPLGIKLNKILDEKGIAGDYAALASVFGVTPPSAREWVQFGRLSKERYQTLVEWSGRSLHWWFDIPEDIPREYRYEAAEPTTHMVRETASSWPDRWPFRSITSDELRQLPDQALREIEAFARGVISQHPVIKRDAA